MRVGLPICWKGLREGNRREIVLPTQPGNVFHSLDDLSSAFPGFAEESDLSALAGDRRTELWSAAKSVFPRRGTRVWQSNAYRAVQAHF